MEELKNPNKRSLNFMYIMFMFEYFITLSITSQYIVKIGIRVGIENSIIALIQNFVSCACVLQVFTIFLANKHPYKPWLIVANIVNFVLFGSIWFVPLFNVSILAKTILLICFVFMGYSIYNMTTSIKQAWFFGFAKEGNRGKVESINETISVFGSIFFLYGLKKLIEVCDNSANDNLTYICCGCLILLLMILSVFCTIFIRKESYNPVLVEKAKTEVKSKLNIKGLFTKDFICAIVLCAGYSICAAITFPIFQTEWQKTYGISANFITLVVIFYSIVRTIVTVPLGKYADKKSFSKGLTLVYIALIIGFIVQSFNKVSPEVLFVFDGEGITYSHIIVVVFYFFYAIACSGTNNFGINIVLDTCKIEDRAKGLAVKGVFCGIIGFLSYLAIMPLYNYLVELQHPIYSPNFVFSCIGAFIILFLTVFNIAVVRRIKRKPIFDRL